MKASKMTVSSMNRSYRLLATNISGESSTEKKMNIVLVVSWHCIRI